VPDEFDPHMYELAQPDELLVPLSKLTFVAYTPELPGYFNPLTLKLDQVELEWLGNLQRVVEEEREFEERLIVPEKAKKKKRKKRK
jgi:hypothetical protein